MRRPRTTAASVLILLSLSGCGGSRVAFDPKPVTQLADGAGAAPAALTRPCRRPAPMSSGSAGAVERKIAADVTALKDCEARRAATVEFYASRDAALAGAPPPAP